MDVKREHHVISIELSAEDWRAFLASQPQPVDWLRQRIQESIAHAHKAPTASQAEPAAMA